MIELIGCLMENLVASIKVSNSLETTAFELLK
jgi:hypothetical protein